MLIAAILGTVLLASSAYIVYEMFGPVSSNWKEKKMSIINKVMNYDVMKLLGTIGVRQYYWEKRRL